MTIRRPQPLEIAQFKTQHRAATAKALPFVSATHEYRSDYDFNWGWGLSLREKEIIRKRNAARAQRKLRNKRK